MVSNVVVGTSNTDIVTVPSLKTYAVVLVNFCNTSTTGDETVSLWCVPSGGSASDTTAVWKGNLIEALQTRKFDGKFLMAAGDKLIALSANDTTYEASKTVTRISGSYNVSTNNFRVTATRSQNNSTTYADTIVKIANVACTVSITLPASRLRSGGSDGTSAQNHVVTLTANQQLYAAPTLTAGLGTWQGGGFAGGPTVWTRSLQITDAMVKGAYSFSSLTATNLAGIVTNTILSGSSYTVGGFVSRQITLAAFANEANMNVEATDYTKVTLSWDFKPSLVTRSPLDSTPPIVDNWCLVALNTNPTVIRILDTAATSSCSVASIITIEEAV